MARNSRDRDDDRDDDRGSRSRGRERDDDRGARRGGSRDRDDDRDGRGGGKRRGGGDYEYAGRSSEENTQRQRQGSSRYDSFLVEEVVWFSAKSGENCVRIIPWLNKKFENFDDLVERYGKHWGIDAIIHRNVGADKGTYLCPDKMEGKPCPMCDFWREEDEEKLKPSDRVLCWVIDRKDEKAGPKLWNMPLGVSKDIQAASQDRQSGEWYPVEHPDEGYDIYFDREGEKDRTRYKQFELAKKPSPLHENPDKMERWLDFVMDKPLPELLKIYDAEHLEKVLSGQRKGGGDDDDRPRRSRDRDGDRDSGRSSSRRGGRDDDDSSDRGRGRDRDDDRGSERSSRRRGGDDDDAAEGEFTRPARRRNDDDGDEPGDREEADSGRSRGRGEDRGSGGKTTERYRPKDEDKGGKGKGKELDDDIPFDKDDDTGDDKEDTAQAKENLRRVGRRSSR